MNSQIMGLRVAGVVFGLMSLAQLWRLIVQPAVLVAGHVMPLWPSVLAFLLLASLCFWLLNMTHHHHI
jgi:O-antigen/teichoic acid export membrane protein